MKINYLLRTPKIGFSIEKVFNTLINEICKENTVTKIYLPRKGSMPLDVVLNNIYTFKFRNSSKINHVTGHIHDILISLIGCRNILTIHDLVFLDNTKNPIKWLYKWLFWLYIPIKIANKVTCISNKTKEGVLKYIKTDKLVVIHNPVDPKFIYKPKEFNSECPRILHIGTGWNKNLIKTIESLEDINCHFRIIGKTSNEILQILDKHKLDYSMAFGLTDDEIVEEYIKADIISFPSEYEGFGMPIIEGQAVGRPVLTSKIQPLIEVSGDAVCYVDCHDLTSIRNGFLEIINNSNYREDLILRGIENSKRFALDKISQQYLDLYKKI